jgi:hypothetical protein
MNSKVIYFFIILFIISSNSVSAHPGRTDSSGGHTCRTNCEQWGLDYGEYHFHNSYIDTSESDYQEGYNEGYELSYGYASQCEPYEWSWEGTQDFGDGFEQGIEDGDQEGRLICYEDSYAVGEEQGYSDYLDGYEYSEEPNPNYDSDSYIKGYAEGYATAKSEDTIPEDLEDVVSYTSNDDDGDTSNNYSQSDLELSSSEEEAVFEEGYDEGYEAATEDHTYNDYENEFSEQELNVYRKGYFSGYIEGGGGTIGQVMYYYFIQEYIVATLLSTAIILSGILWLLYSRKNKKKEEMI